MTDGRTQFSTMIAQRMEGRGMKIVQEGVRPPKYMWADKQYSCVYCHSVIEMDETDDDAVIDWGDDQREGIWVRIICPVCKQARTLSVVRPQKG